MGSRVGRYHGGTCEVGVAQRRVSGCLQGKIGEAVVDEVDRPARVPQLAVRK